MKDRLSNNQPVQESGLELATQPLEAALDRVPPPGELSPLFSKERYFAFLKRNWWILAACVVAFLIPAAAYVRYWPVTYAATARMWVAGRVNLQNGAVFEEQPMTFEATQIGLLESETIRQRALARLREQPDLNTLVGPNFESAPFSVHVNQIRNGGLLELKGKGPTKESVKAFLNALMDEFLLYKNETRLATSSDTFISLQKDIEKQQVELTQEQDKLTTYGRDNNITVQEQQAQAAGTYLSQLLTELSQLNIQFQLINQSLQSTQSTLISAATPVILDTAQLRLGENGASSANLDNYMAAQEELQKLKLTQSRLSNDLRPQHPKMIKLEAQIKRDEELIGYFRQLNREQLTAMRQNLKSRMDAIQQTIKDWEVKVGSASGRIAEYEQLKNNVDRAQAIESQLLNLLQSASVGMDLNRQTVAILDRPSRAKSTKLPSLIVLPLALFMGICAGTVLILMVQRFSDIVTSAEDLRWKFDEWLLGQVPNVASGKKPCRIDLFNGQQDKLSFGESFCNLRSAILFGTNDTQQQKVFLVTSATPEEGKSTVAANLAITLAKGGSRVLLVDGDLRCGHLHELFGITPAKGLTELLAQDENPEPYIVSTSMPDLCLLPRGAQKNEGALFLRSSFDSLLRHARTHFDYVVIDSMPVFAADDTANVAPKVDGVLFVVRGSFVGAATVRSALQELYARRASVLGIVFNRANSASNSYYYGKYEKYYSKTEPSVFAAQPAVAGPSRT